MTDLDRMRNMFYSLYTEESDGGDCYWLDVFDNEATTRVTFTFSSEGMLQDAMIIKLE